MLNNLEEKTWIARCKLLGDEKAFARLVDKYKDRVERFFLMQTGGRQDLSDDLAQETFIRVWQNMGSLRQFATFSTWLYRIAYNIWLDHCRTARNRLPVTDYKATEHIAEPPAAGERMEQNERHDQLMAALAQLSEHERTCMVLFYMQEMSIKEIAAVTHYNESTIRCNLHRGRERLRSFTYLQDI